MLVDYRLTAVMPTCKRSAALYYYKYMGNGECHEDESQVTAVVGVVRGHGGGSLADYLRLRGCVRNNVILHNHCLRWGRDP